MRGLIPALCATTLSMVAGCTNDLYVRGECARGAPAATRVSATSASGVTWTTELPGPTEKPPLIAEGYVLVGQSCGYSVLDLDDGHVVRTSREAGTSTLGIADGFVYVETLDDVDGTSAIGRPIVDPPEGGTTKRDISGDGETWTRVVDSTVYVMGDGAVSRLAPVDGAASRLAPFDGTQGWWTQLPVLSRPTISHTGELAIVTSSDGSIYALSRSDGTVRWRQTLPGTSFATELTTRSQGDVLEVTSLPNEGRASRTTLRLADGEILEAGAKPRSGARPPLGQGLSLGGARDRVGHHPRLRTTAADAGGLTTHHGYDARCWVLVGHC